MDSRRFRVGGWGWAQPCGVRNPGRMEPVLIPSLDSLGTERNRVSNLPHDNADIIRHDPLLRHEVAEHLRPQRRVRERQRVRRGHPLVIERREERVRDQVFPRVVLDVRGVKPGERNVGKRIRDILCVDPPAALDLRPGEQDRVHAVPERAALEELLLRPRTPKVL